jgi:hypothetical protein
MPQLSVISRLINMNRLLLVTIFLVCSCSFVFASNYQSANIAGNAATATALAANGANCGANQAAGGVNASGAAEACISPVLSEVDPTVDTSAEIQTIIGSGVYATSTQGGKADTALQPNAVSGNGTTCTITTISSGLITAATCV